MNDQHMTDKEMDAVLRTWTPDAPAGHPDRSRVVGNVVRQLHSARRRRRRRRWWLIAAFRGMAGAPKDAEMHIDPASHIPATNGHTATAVGRTQSMFSPVKAITAGALVFALGGVLFIAQPFGQQASVPGATTDEGRAAPVEVTARWVFGPEIRIGTEETIDGVIRAAGYAWRPAAIVRPSDPRLDGRLSIAANSDDHAASGGPTVWHWAFRIENDEGAWQMRPSVGLTHVDGTNAPEIGVFDGEGAYEGLTAVVTIQVDPDAEAWDLRGYILDGGLPPEPEPVVGE